MNSSNGKSWFYIYTKWHNCYYFMSTSILNISQGVIWHQHTLILPKILEIKSFETPILCNKEIDTWVSKWRFDMVSNKTTEMIQYWHQYWKFQYRRQYWKFPRVSYDTNSHSCYRSFPECKHWSFYVCKSKMNTTGKKGIMMAWFGFMWHHWQYITSMSSLKMSEGTIWHQILLMIQMLTEMITNIMTTNQSIFVSSILDNFCTATVNMLWYDSVGNWSYGFWYWKFQYHSPYQSFSRVSYDTTWFVTLCYQQELARVLICYHKAQTASPYTSVDNNSFHI